jgi:hypothetical protein
LARPYVARVQVRSASVTPMGPLSWWDMCGNRTGHEVDVFLDMPEGAIVPQEAKAGRTVASDAFDGLRYRLAFGRRPGRARWPRCCARRSCEDLTCVLS